MKKLTVDLRLGAFARALEKFQEIDPQIRPQTIHTFIEVYKHEEIHLSDLCDLLDLSQAGVSRNVRALSKINRHRVKGPGFVDIFEDPENWRQRIVKITEQGKDFAEEVAMDLEVL